MTISSNLNPKDEYYMQEYNLVKKNTKKESYAQYERTSLSSAFSLEEIFRKEHFK
jgi:hypothetical protein